MPLGSDREKSSQFQLIAGTNRDLSLQVDKGRFREDLLARINLWRYRLPSLKDRIEDLEANIDYELDKFGYKANTLISFNKPARARYLEFSQSPAATWNSNFRDLNSSITRMATLAEGGRITQKIVEEEIQRLLFDWRKNDDQQKLQLNQWLDENTIDTFDRIQLAGVIKICNESRTAAEAGRKLFNVSRLKKSSSNDSHRVIRFLQKFGLDFQTVTEQ